MAAKSQESSGRNHTSDISVCASLMTADLEAIKDLSLDVRRGEILGVAGVSGNGQRELVQTIIGLEKICVRIYNA